uniref:(northern house mosquito) hypothetical protein n=1 Tax=Culex pipiens TaxID=7175 RepID=A0A8D8C681_CULPI
MCRMFRQGQLDVSAVRLGTLRPLRAGSRVEALVPAEPQHLHQHGQSVGLLLQMRRVCGERHRRQRAGGDSGRAQGRRLRHRVRDVLHDGGDQLVQVGWRRHPGKRQQYVLVE